MVSCLGVSVFPLLPVVHRNENYPSGVSHVVLCSPFPDEVTVVFLSCPLVKKHADLLASFLYFQSTMKDMYSKPANRTELFNPMKTNSLV